MANFSKNNFIIPVGVDSSSLRIRDTKGQLKYTILNNSNTTFFNTGSFVIIRTQGDTTDIKLDFSCLPEAIQGLNMLNTEFAKLKRNLASKKQTDLIDLVDDIVGDGVTAKVEPKKFLFTNETDADMPIADGQLEFHMPDKTTKIQSVYINGIVINDYSYNEVTKVITINPDMIGYGIEGDDEVMVNYFI
jgi:hypothetical protein